MRLREFAPSPERDDNDDVPDQLVVLANRWWNAGDKQPQIEHVLNSLGWSIHQVESEDDAVQLQHRDGTTHFISADDFDPDLFEISDELRQNYLHRAGKHVDRRMDRMAQVRDRLNKGYEIYHADRPTAIVDRFDANTSADARRYYEKFVHEYESDVDFDLRLRRSTGIMEDKRQQLDFDSLYGKAFKITDHSGNPDNPGFSIVTPLNGDSWNWRERPEFKDIVKRKLNQPGWLGDHKYQQIIDFMAGNKFDPAKHLVKEISRLPKSELGDWGKKGTLADPKHPVKTKPLPGGSKFSYAINRPDAETIEIMIFDGTTLAAEMDLYYTKDYMKTWKVDTVVADPDYRGQGLGKALYGIALSILRLTLEAGETQTKHGQQMWLMLNSIPGVEVQGYNMTPTNEYQPQRGDNIVDQNKDWTRYTFPVKPGTSSMRSGRQGTGIYTSQASMIAKWTGQ
jgi:GNAT superfamily N-acetyltransferase